MCDGNLKYAFCFSLQNNLSAHVLKEKVRHRHLLLLAPAFLVQVSSYNLINVYIN
jgi:hypothetical protein